MQIILVTPWETDGHSGPVRLIAEAAVELAIRGRFADRLAGLWPLRRLPGVPPNTLVWMLAPADEARAAVADLPEPAATPILLTPLHAFWTDPTGSVPEAVDPDAPGPAPDRPFGPLSRAESVDWLAVFWSILQRAEEYDASAPRDSHGRFPAWASALHRKQWLDRPIADDIAARIAGIFKELQLAGEGAMPAAAGGGNGGRRAWTLALTHDVDSIRYWSWRRLGASILKRAPDLDLNEKKPRRGVRVVETRPDRLLVRTVRAPWFPTLRSTIDQRSDPYFVFPWLRQWEAGHGLKPTVFVLPERRTQFEPYDLRWAERSKGYARGLIRHVRRWSAEGAEIGLHPPYDAPEHPVRLAAQRSRIESIVEQGSVTSARYHWLRLRVPEGWTSFADAGIRNDASLGHSQREGFRAGTCHPYLAMDLRRGSAIGIVEVPLVVMDTTLRFHREMTPGGAFTTLMNLMAQCRARSGVFTLLWHTNSFDRYEWRGWRRVFKRVIEAALDQGGVSRTISETADAHRTQRQAALGRLLSDTTKEKNR